MTRQEEFERWEAAQRRLDRIMMIGFASQLIANMAAIASLVFTLLASMP